MTMSWLSGGISQLSSLTDQFSTFTKEVLTEATQEIEDPVTELQLCKKRVEEVEGQNAQYQIELERLKKRNEELEERSDTAEYQVASINQEYRKLLQEKDEEVKKLREQCKEMKEQQKKLVFSSSESNLFAVTQNINKEQKSFSAAGGLATFQDVNLGEQTESDGVSGQEFEWMEGWGNEDVDFDVPGLQSQSHVTQLQSEFARLQVECQHWKDYAKQRLQDDDSSMNRNTSTEHIQELKDQLQQERQQHEHELTALQSLHTQQLEIMSARHKQETDHLKLKYQNETNGGDLEEMKVKDLHHEEIQQETVKLIMENKELVKRLSTMEEGHTKLVEKLQNSQEVIGDLHQAIGCMKLMLRTYQKSHLDHIKTEREALTQSVQELHASFQNHQETINELQTQQNHFENEAEMLTSHVETLQVELKTKQKEIDELKEKEKQSCVEQEEVNMSFIDHKEGTIDTNFNVSESERALTKVDNLESLKAQVTQLRNENSDLQQRVETLQESGSESQLDLLRQQLSKEQSKREQLQSHLAQIMSEHDQELSEILETREDLTRELTSVKKEMNTSYMSEIEQFKLDNLQLREEITQLKAQQSQSFKDQKLLEQYNNEVDNRGPFIEGDESTEGRGKGDGMAEISVQYSSDKEIHILRTKNDQLEVEVKGLQSLLQEKEEVIQQMRNELSSKVPSLSEQLDESQSNLTRVLQERDSLEQQLSEANSTYLKEKELVEGERVQLEQKLQNLVVEIASNNSHQQKLVQFENLLQDKEEELKVLNTDRDGLLVRLEAQIKESSSLSDELTSLRQEFRNKEDLLVVLREERNQLDVKLEETRAELMKMEINRSEYTERSTESDINYQRVLKQNQSLQLQCDKNQKELKRLRTHLIQVEEQHTQEALHSDHRESQLKQQLKVLEEKLAKNSSQEMEQNFQAQYQVDLLQQEIEKVNNEKDTVLLELSHTKEECKQNISAIQNLQAVLEHFQRDQSAEVNISLIEKEKELELVRKECEQLREQQLILESASHDASIATESLTSLQEEIKMKNERIVKMSAELEKYQVTLNKSKLKIEQMSSEEESKVDRSLVRNLFLTYLSSQNKKEEIYQLICKILDISQQELDKSLGRKNSWLSRIWQSQTPSTPVSPVATSNEQSFSKLFVTFLETESAPTPTKAPPLHPPETTPSTHPPLPSHIVALPTSSHSQVNTNSDVNITATVLNELLTEK